MLKFKPKSFRQHHWQRTYRKLKNRLDRALENGSFQEWSRRKKYKFLKRMRRYAQRLMQPLPTIPVKAMAKSVALSTALITTAATPAMDNSPSSTTALSNLLMPPEISIAVSPATVSEDGMTNIVYTFTRTGATTDAPVIKFELGGSASFGTDYTISGETTLGSRTITIPVGASSADLTISSMSDSVVELDETVIVSVPEPTTFGVSSQNVFGFFDVGNNATPTFADLDNDGDLDAFVGSINGNIFYLQNDGTGNLAPNTANNPFNGVNIGFGVAPTFADWDNDNDLDAFVGNIDGNIIYFQNDGAGNLSSFASDNTDNPFNGIDVFSSATPTFADIDGDNDLDAFVGNNVGYIVYFQNDGAGNLSSFASNDANNPFAGVDIVNNAAPVFADLDDDGDLDAFIGNSAGNIIYFQNDGAGNLSSFASNDANNPFAGVDIGGNATPAFADLDNDGDLDAFVGESFGGVFYFPNEAPPIPYEVNLAANEATGTITNDDILSEITVSLNSTTVTEDAGNDLVYTFTRSGSTTAALEVAFKLGGTASAINDYTLTGETTPGSRTITIPAGAASADLTISSTNDQLIESDETVIVIVPQPARAISFGPILQNPFGLVDVGYSSVPAFADLDDDGDLDVFVGERDGGIFYFQNDGSGNLSSFASNNASNPFNGVDAGFFSKPAFADLDDDDDLDAFVGNSDGNIIYFQNDGSGNLSSFASSDAGNPFNGIDVGDHSMPAFVDLDEDGDLDAFVGERNGGIFYFQNDGAGNLVSFASNNADNPFNGIDVGTSAIPTFADLDRDSNLDAFVGNSNGNIIYILNNGADRFISFAANNSNNPFNGVDIGSDATPTFADLDDDGDLDAFVGERYGIISYFTNETPPIPYEINLATNSATGTITNDDSTPEVSISLSPNSIAEDAGNDLVYTFTRTGNTTAPLVIAFELSGTASTVNDFTITGETTLGSRTITIPAGMSSADLTISSTNDQLIESDETVIVSIPQPTLEISFGASSINPFGLSDIGNEAAPTLADWEQDGDPDIFVGENNGGIFYFQNDNTISLNSFASSSTNNPFIGVNLISNAAPAFADLDDDGDLDAFVGNANGYITYFQNDGSNVLCSFASDNTNNPFVGINVGNSAAPTFADFDNDSDLDAFVGNSNGNITYFQNDGSGNLSSFASNNTNNPFNGIFVGFSAKSTFADLDNDGDLDAIVGNGAGNIIYLQNDGSGNLSSFPPNNTDNPFFGVDVGSSAVPIFADLDHDGDLDAFIGNFAGNIVYFPNETQPVPYEVNSAAQEATGTITNDDIVPEISLSLSPASVVEDAGTDLVYTFTRTGNTTAELVVAFELSGTASAADDYTLAGETTLGSRTVTIPAGMTSADLTITITNDQLVESDETVIVSIPQPLVQPSLGASTQNPFGFVDVGSSATPTFADLDKDGDLDAFVGNSNGHITYFQNDGSANLSSFTFFNTDNPFNGMDVGSSAAPTFADLDKDGDLDVFVGNSNGHIIYFQNDGSGNLSSFASDNSNNPFNGMGVGSSATPTFADLDQDGDLDAFVGKFFGNITYFQNDGSANLSSFASDNSNNPFNGAAIGLNTNPTFADLDQDGDLDAFVGDSNGNIIYFQNDGAGNLSSFASDNSNNPFNGIDVGSRAAIVFADLDNDSDLDAFTGNSDGHIIYFPNETDPITYLVASNAGTATATIENDDAALPLDLLSFTGKVEKEQSHLFWRTANERNVAGYQLEWQNNNVEWKEIGYQKATNEAEATYNFWHTQPATGINYYRLRSVDTDGKETLSNIVALEFALANTELVVYPNPNKGQFSVVLPTNFSELEPTELMIRDMTGRLVYRTQVNGQIDLQLTDLPTGQYVLQLMQGERTVIGKLVIE